MNITTTYKTNGAGRSQILAKGHGKQRTVNYDQSKSSDWNHGTAAGVLILALAQTDDRFGGLDTAVLVNIDRHTIDHTANESGTQHRFDV